MRAHRKGGFTLLELLFVLVISAIVLSFGVQNYQNYLARTSARRAAQVFARDLRLARSSAVRARETVFMYFDEAGLEYWIVTASGLEVVRRYFDSDADVHLDSINLDLPGDSLVFDSRGMAALAGGLSALGSATFAAADLSVQVSFNGLGASRVQ